MSTWAGRDITPTLLSHAWRIRSVLCRTKSAIFQGRPQCPLYVAPLMERCYHQRNGGTGKLPKPMPPKPYEGRSDLTLGGLLTTAPAFLIVNHNRYLFRLSWYLARRCPATTPDMQTRTSQCVSVIANRLSCLSSKTEADHDTDCTELSQLES